MLRFNFFNILGWYLLGLVVVGWFVCTVPVFESAVSSVAWLSWFFSITVLRPVPASGDLWRRSGVSELNLLQCIHYDSLLWASWILFQHPGMFVVFACRHPAPSQPDFLFHVNELLVLLLEQVSIPFVSHTLYVCLELVCPFCCVFSYIL